MRIDPKNLGRKRKETKKRLLEALKKIGIELADEPFDAIKQSDGVWDIVIGKERFLVETKNRR